VSSIARPNGNITGIATDAGLEILGKRLGLLLEAIPRPSNVKYLISREAWERYEGRLIEDLSKQLSIAVRGALLEGKVDETQYRRVFAAMEQDRVDALMVSAEGVNVTYGRLLADLAAKSRIPTVYSYRSTVALGGLMAYAYDLPESFRQAANAIGRILKGANPGDIPFYQATKYELVINVKAAKALGLEIPPALLLRADEVIE
jgi:putative tryptophan/tyrosine transport system substrate-binding protein